MPMKCYVHAKSQFRGKNMFYHKTFPSLVLPGNVTTVTSISNVQFPLSYLLVVAYRRLNKKENFKLLALKVFAVACERWSLTRGSQYSELAEKLLVFWKTGLLRRGGRLPEVVAYQRWPLTRGGRNQRFDCIHGGAKGP